MLCVPIMPKNAVFVEISLGYTNPNRAFKSMFFGIQMFHAMPRIVSTITAVRHKLTSMDTRGQREAKHKDYRRKGRSGGDERRLGMQAQQLSITGIQYMHTIDVKESADLQPFDS